MANKPRIYIDSCCFIDLVKTEVGKLPTLATADVWYTKQLLQAHKDGEIEVLTSILSVVECVGVDSGEPTVPFDVQAHFRRLLSSGQYVRLLQTTPRTGMIGQDLRWKHGLVLKGPDAIHFASAVETGANEFLTNDDQLKKKKVADAVPKLQAAAGLRVILPSKTGCLPDKYKQGDMLNA